MFGLFTQPSENESQNQKWFSFKPSNTSRHMPFYILIGIANFSMMLLYRSLTELEQQNISPSYKRICEPLLSPVSTFMLSVAIYPLLEEIFDRGITMYGIKNIFESDPQTAPYANSISLIGSSILFSYRHDHDIQIPALVTGLIFGKMTQAHQGNLLPGYVSHFVSNLLNFIYLYYQYNDNCMIQEENRRLGKFF